MVWEIHTKLSDLKSSVMEQPFGHIQYPTKNTKTIVMIHDACMMHYAAWQHKDISQNTQRPIALTLTSMESFSSKLALGTRST